MLANTRWNIFARVLEDILTAHHLNWQDLHERAGIEQATVDRLQASLSSPDTFPTLTVEEIDDVIDFFDLEDDEILQLRAAIIVTPLESRLMEYIENSAALQTAEQVFMITLTALQNYTEAKRGDAGSRGDDGPQVFFHKIKGYIDTGTNIRLLSSSLSGESRKHQLQKALQCFEQARLLLERKEMLFGSMKQWKQHYQQVQKACLQIRNEL